MQFAIVIPIRDAERWLRAILNYYRAHGVEPFYILDTRSCDRTRQYLHEANAAFFEYEGAARCIEDGIIEFAAEQIPYKYSWTLRIDDDEVPSTRLLEWLKTADCEEFTMWAISRREIMPGFIDPHYSRYWSHYHTPGMPEYLNAQVRLYQHKEVEFCREIHSPGFKYNDLGFVPQDCPVYHLDAVLRSFRERLDKLLRYEERYPGSSFKYAAHYLPELVPEVQHSVVPVPIEDLGFALFSDLPKTELAKSVRVTYAELQAIKLTAPDRQDREVEMECERMNMVLQNQEKHTATFASRPLGELLCTLSRLSATVFGKTPFIEELDSIGARWQAAVKPVKCMPKKDGRRAL